MLLNACYGKALLIWVLVHWDHPGISYTSLCDWLVLFLTFAANITQVGFESFFLRQLSATNRASLFDSYRLFRISEFTSLFISSSKHGSKVPPSKRREPVRRDRIILRASLETEIGQASGFSLLKDALDHARDRKQRNLHVPLIFECTTGSPSSRLEKKPTMNVTFSSFDRNNSDGKASLKWQKSPETTKDT